MAEGAAGVQRGPIAGVDAVLTGRYPMAQRCEPATWKEGGYRLMQQENKVLGLQGLPEQSSQTHGGTQQLETCERVVTLEVGRADLPIGRI